MDERQKEKQLKVFGYGLPLILGVFGLRHGFKHGGDVLSIVLLSLSAIVLIITLSNRPLLIKIFESWMKVMLVIGTLVTGTILVTLYYLVFTPIALVLKFKGKDFMNRRWDQKVSSYWIFRDTNAIKTKYTQQF